MRLRFFSSLLVLGSLLSSPAFSQSGDGGFGVVAGEIAIQERESPVAANHGILPTLGRADSFSWAGSDAITLRLLLQELQTPLAWKTQRIAAVAALSAPVLPDAEGSVPENWLLLRLEALHRLGEYEGAWNLFRTLNTNFLTEPVARMGANLGWASRRITRACRLTAAITENESTRFESGDSRLYWLVHYLLCQRLSGKVSEAEVSLGLLQESVPKKLPPLLAPLVEGWGTKSKLPPLTAKDALIYPALSALLIDPLEEGAPLSQRIPENFVTLALVNTLPPELQSALAQVSSLPPLLRAYMAENALRYHFLDGNQVGRYYMAVAEKAEKPKDQALEETYRRALLYADAKAARTPRNKAQAITEALRVYHRSFSADSARAILGTQLRQLQDEQETAMELSLAFETMALYLDRGDREKAAMIARSLNQKDDPSSELSASVAGRILTLSGTEREYGSDNIALPSFAQSPEAPIVWLAGRYGRIMEALGYQIRWPQSPLEASAPLPDITYASPERLNALHKARNAPVSPAEQILRAALVLADVPPQRTSDQATLQVMDTLNALGLRSLANELAAEALLGIPDRRED
jgi:hypothetical protein